VRERRHDLVIFDSDGVLVDSERLSNQVLADMISALGCPTTRDEAIVRYMGRTLATCVELIETRIGRPVPDTFVSEFRARTFEFFGSDLEAVPGIVDALERIDLPMCVASSGPIEKLRLTLGTTGLLPRFEGRLFSAVDVGRSKPHPDVFLHAASEMGVAPDRVAVVEDSLQGVRGARAAGMRVLGFARDLAPEVLAAEGAEVFQAMDALPELLGCRSG
jgi:HAD superfamily hydrolase (TIGR01509 family)